MSRRNDEEEAPIKPLTATDLVIIVDTLIGACNQESRDLFKFTRETRNAVCRKFIAILDTVNIDIEQLLAGHGTQ